MFKRLSVLLALAVLILWSGQAPLHACTIFNAKEGAKVLVGNNEDGGYDGHVQFLVAQGGEYGRMNVRSRYPNANDPIGTQGGMNDQGLFYDWNALAQREIDLDPNKENYPYYLADYILRTCATVEEVLDMYEQYNEPIFSRAQIQWVDATGASCICGYNDNAGEQQCAVKTGRFQVSTNFNVFTSSSTDWRYDTATTWLTNWPNISEALFSHILTLVENNTLYSNVYDLNNRIMYLYHHDPNPDFSNVAVIDLDAELAEGSHSHDMEEFTYDTRNDYIPPGVTNFNPANLSLTVQPGANLVMTFTEPVYEGSGNITIKQNWDDQVFETISIGSVSGLGTKTITINPTQNFTNGRRYYVLMDDTCLVDADGMAYHGLLIKESWRFGIVAQ